MPMNAETAWNKKYPNKYAICLYCNSIYYQSISPGISSQWTYSGLYLFHKGFCSSLSISVFLEFKWNLKSISVRNGCQLLSTGMMTQIRPQVGQKPGLGQPFDLQLPSVIRFPCTFAINKCGCRKKYL